MSNGRKPIHLMMRHKVTLQQKILTEDGAGGYSTAWEDVATLWAQITPLRGSETTSGGKISAPSSHRFRVRYSSTVQADMRLLFDGRTFNIRAIQNTDEKNHMLEVLVEEDVAN